MWSEVWAACRSGRLSSAPRAEVVARPPPPPLLVCAADLPCLKSIKSWHKPQLMDDIVEKLKLLDFEGSTLRCPPYKGGAPVLPPMHRSFFAIQYVIRH